MNETETSPQYEAIMLAKALDIFKRRNWMAHGVVMDQLGLAHSSYHRFRNMATHRHRALESVWLKIAAYHENFGVPKYKMRLALPFPPDPHGDHPECT